jgi:branched-chain amino acid transport system ATP-binding protein
VSAAALETVGVTVRFGGNVALHDVSLRADAGMVTGLIGPNGAGKTTLFNVVSGLLTPDRGRVRMSGTDITRLAPYRRARLGLARTFQRLELFTLLTVRANLRVAADLYRSHTRDRSVQPDLVAGELLERLGLVSVADVVADELPTGQARLVELGRALASRPKVLLLDEPASGQDESETHAFASLIRELAADGMAVLLVEHDVRLVMQLCSLVHVLDFGEILAVGDPAAVQADDRVVTAYLGDLH